MVFVITGGPGFGKTVLINRLGEMGFRVGEESARKLIEQQQAIEGDILPWKNGSLFEKVVMQNRIDFIKSVKENEVGFSDRGLPDQAGYSLYKGFPVSKVLSEAIKFNRYELKVFFAPPWIEIYQNDNVRKESFEEALSIHIYLLKAYQFYGYEMIEIPKKSIEERVEFILNKSLLTNYNY